MLLFPNLPWLLHYDGSSCNGCDIEVLACLTPVYDVERFGVINTGNPKHADIFLITGGINHQNARSSSRFMPKCQIPRLWWQLAFAPATAASLKNAITFWEASTP